MRQKILRARDEKAALISLLRCMNPGEERLKRLARKRELARARKQRENAQASEGEIDLAGWLATVDEDKVTE